MVEGGGNQALPEFCPGGIGRGFFAATRPRPLAGPPVLSQHEGERRLRNHLLDGPPYHLLGRQSRHTQERVVYRKETELGPRSDRQQKDGICDATINRR